MTIIDYVLYIGLFTLKTFFFPYHTENFHECFKSENSMSPNYYTKVAGHVGS